MMRLSGITAMVIDNGMNVELARTLGKAYGKVRYFHPWEGEAPLLHDANIGKGFKEFERVESWIKYLDETDLFIFPDLCYGETQLWLEAQGKLVWGSRMAEELEFDRIGTKKLMEKMGLPVWPYHECHGYAELEAYIKDHPESWVKFSKYRAHFETFFVENYGLSRMKLHNIFTDIMPLAEKVTFTVEKNMPDAFEIAVDTYNIKGEFPKRVLSGIEAKNVGYIGMMSDFDDLIPALTEFDRAFQPYLKKKNYINCWSAEKRIGEDGIGYMNDVAARSPSPPSETYEMLFGNFPEIIARGAEGILIEAEKKPEIFTAELMVYTENDQDWQSVEFPKEFRDNVKLRNCCKIDGKYWIVPKESPNNIIGSVVTVGKTLEDAVEEAQEIAKSIKGDSINVPSDALAKVQKEIDKAESYGLSVLGK